MNKDIFNCSDIWALDQDRSSLTEAQEIELDDRIAVRCKEKNICPWCVEAVSEGMGEIDEEYCVATEERIVEGEEIKICVQCAECLDEYRERTRN